MTTLCIETATENGMVVIVRDDGTTASVNWRSAGRHGEDLFGHIEAGLAEAGATREELSLIGVDIGPGKFTSLRVGLATAKGLALGLDLPIVGVSSLLVRARSIDAGAAQVRVPVMNAYRGDVFCAAYLIDGAEVQALVPAVFGAPDQVFRQIREAVGDRSISVVGEGVAQHMEAIRTLLGAKTAVESAFDGPTPEGMVAEVRHVMHAAGPSDLSSLEPQYLRPSDAQLPDRPLQTEHSS